MYLLCCEGYLSDEWNENCFVSFSTVYLGPGRGISFPFNFLHLCLKGIIIIMLVVPVSNYLNSTVIILENAGGDL